MPQTTQTFRNHARLVPPFHFFVLPVLLLNFLGTIRNVYQLPSSATVWALVVAAALLMFALLARNMAVTVQDRVIRLEMRLRLKEVLPLAWTVVRPRLPSLALGLLLILISRSAGLVLPATARIFIDEVVTGAKPEKMRIVFAPSRAECSIHSQTCFFSWASFALSVTQKSLRIAVPLTGTTARAGKW